MKTALKILNRKLQHFSAEEMNDEAFLAALRWQYFVLLLSVLASFRFSWKYINICDPETACGCFEIIVSLVIMIAILDLCLKLFTFSIIQAAEIDSTESLVTTIYQKQKWILDGIA